MTNDASEYEETSKRRWIDGVSELPMSGSSQTWEGVNAIKQVLPHMLMEGANHAFYPSHGGLDWISLAHGRPPSVGPV